MTEITIHDEQPKENQAPMGDMTGSKRRVKKTYDGVTVEAYSYETQIEELKRAERINRVFLESAMRLVSPAI